MPPRFTAKQMPSDTLEMDRTEGRQVSAINIIKQNLKNTLFNI